MKSILRSGTSTMKDLNIIKETAVPPRAEYQKVLNLKQMTSEQIYLIKGDATVLWNIQDFQLV